MASKFDGDVRPLSNDQRGRWAYFGEFLLDVLAVFGIVAGGFLLAKLIEVLS